MRTILLAHVKRVVIKVGSGVISDHSGLDLERIATLCEDVHALRQRGYEVILVSSAAVAAGKADLGIKGSAQALPLPIKQAAAAIGPRVVVPIHERSADPEAFRSQCECPVVLLEP